MKKLFLTLTLILAVTTLWAQKIKVACVGNSITYGAGVANAARNSYPAQLSYRLGDQYEVRNFGVSATTLMTNGNSPYINTGQYKASLEYQPDIVTIKLGTNDSKSFNRDKLKENYKKDYQALIDSYKALPSKPRIILLAPVPCYITDNEFAGANSVYEATIIPAIKELAYENSLELVDLYHTFDKNVWQEHIMPDKLHPTSLGMTIIADRLANTFLRPTCDFRINVEHDKTFNFHGYKGYKMGNNLIVEPRRTTVGNPWVIRARFWGHEPQTDIALLESGYHIAYCDVADLYGSPAAVKRYDEFYKTMTSKGLSKKVVLEAMSRGGLIAFNWAARNADKVAAIYADAPVLDFKSWPMGLGKGEGSKGDTENLLKAYGFKDEAAAKNWKKNPVDQIKALSRIPIILVVGDADTVVPIAENSDIFEQQIPNIKVIHKPGIGHHPHSLYNPQPIVEFILKHSGQWRNLCVVPVPGSEYRSGAGWNGGKEWHAISEEITSVLGSKQVDVLFIGNSITQGLGSAGRTLIHNSKENKGAMDNVCGSWENAGISGDRTQHILWRLKNGEYAKCSPKKVFIAIGVNNVIAGNSAEDTAKGILAVLEEASRQFPTAQIYTFGLYPVGKNPTDKARLVHNDIHKILAKSKLPSNVQYMNLEKELCNADGTLKSDVYSGDNIHLVTGGYQTLAKIIKGLL